jgi:hypothetical protein
MHKPLITAVPPLKTGRSPNVKSVSHLALNRLNLAEPEADAEVSMVVLRANRKAANEEFSKFRSSGRIGGYQAIPF